MGDTTTNPVNPVRSGFQGESFERVLLGLFLGYDAGAHSSLIGKSRSSDHLFKLSLLLCKWIPIFPEAKKHISDCRVPFLLSANVLNTLGYSAWIYTL